MSPICQKANDLRVRTEQSLKNVAALARNIEPLLRDLNHQNTADRLAAALGELDALEAETGDFVRTNLEEILTEIARPKGYPAYDAFGARL